MNDDPPRNKFFTIISGNVYKKLALNHFYFNSILNPFKSLFSPIFPFIVAIFYNETRTSLLISLSLSPVIIIKSILQICSRQLWQKSISNLGSVRTRLLEREYIRNRRRLVFPVRDTDERLCS